MDELPPPAAPSRPVPGHSSVSKEGNMATVLGVLAIVLLLGGGLVLLAAVTDSVFLVGLVGSVVVMTLIGLFHYITWGYWLLRKRKEVELAQRNFWEVEPPAVSDVNPHIR